jgi:MFS family permease
MTVNGIYTPDAATPKERVTPLPGARRALILLLAINLFNYIDRYVLAAVEPYAGPELLPGDVHASAKMGSLSMAFLVTYMLLSPVFGWLADRHCRWVLVGVGVILWSLASGASGLAPIFPILFITRCFVGVGEAAYGPVAPTVISDLYPVSIRGSVLSWFYAAIPVGSALGFALGGQVVAARGAAEWRWAFYLVVPPGLVLGLLCFWMRDPVRGQADAVPVTTKRRAGLKDYAALLKVPSYVLNTLGMAAMTFAMGGLAFWMPRYLVSETDAAAWSPIAPQTVFGGLTALAGFLATLAGGYLGDVMRPRFPGSYFLVSGLTMLLGFPMVLLVLWTPFPWAWVFIFLAVFTLFFNTGPTNTILANVCPPAIRASGFALNILVIHAAGDAISPFVIGDIRDRTGNLNGGFILVSAMMVVGGALWLWGSLYLQRDTALAPTRLNDA